MKELLNMAPFDYQGPVRPAMVGQPSETVQHISNPVSGSHSNNRIGCFKIGMESSVSGFKDRRLVVCSRSSSSHQLIGTSSSLFSPKLLYKREGKQLHSSQDGQYHSSNLRTSTGWGPHFHLLCSLALQMWSWCLERNIWIKAEHLSSVVNVAADSESGITKDRCDCMLNPQVFAQLS